ncbi:beta-ketoacyl-[acyl-carrier-protein] synthase family protein [Longispora albida]|uniref:beta-ketoacyl-[acyl-carrier-protein] synthase family protein n=1 Tax=Longispora albida TaxID=203523 RepID=UPI00036453D1|nr:beta-ketoacyl-[acyl-carrier-protein] synthase family protein [Longispora albida]
MTVPGVTITGIGLFTPVGRGADEVFGAMLTGRSGIVRPPEEHPVHGSIEVAGIAAPVESKGLFSGPEVRTIDRVTLLAVLTAGDALADAGIEVGRDVDPYRIGVIGAGVGGIATLENQIVARSIKGRAAISPYLLPGTLPNMASARIAIRHGIRGYSSTVATACAAGAQAIAEAARLIRAGEADVMIAGCSEAPLFPTFAETFDNARALARGWEDPAEACRPFDSRRNGFVLSEGAAFVVLERTDFAEARGATGYADIAGYGGTTDAHHPTTPRPDGESAAECMRRALVSGGIGPAEVGYVNAHGTSTKLGDVAETKALRQVFTSGVPAVSSTKSVTGHLLGASGVVEAAAGALAIARGVLPPTRNLTDPDPECDLDHVVKPREQATSFVLSNSFGFGGQNLSLLIGRTGTSRTRGVL